MPIGSFVFAGGYGDYDGGWKREWKDTCCQSVTRTAADATRLRGRGAAFGELGRETKYLLSGDLPGRCSVLHGRTIVRLLRGT